MVSFAQYLKSFWRRFKYRRIQKAINYRRMVIEKKEKILGKNSPIIIKMKKEIIFLQDQGQLLAH